MAVYDRFVALVFRMFRPAPEVPPPVSLSDLRGCLDAACKNPKHLIDLAHALTEMEEQDAWQYFRFRGVDDTVKIFQNLYLSVGLADLSVPVEKQEAHVAALAAQEELRRVEAG